MVNVMKTIKIKNRIKKADKECRKIASKFVPSKSANQEEREFKLRNFIESDDLYQAEMDIRRVWWDTLPRFRMEPRSWAVVGENGIILTFTIKMLDADTREEKYSMNYSWFFE